MFQLNDDNQQIKYFRNFIFLLRRKKLTSSLSTCLHILSPHILSGRVTSSLRQFFMCLEDLVNVTWYIYILHPHCMYIICPHRGVYCIWIIHSLSALVRHWGEVRKRFHQHKIQSLLGGNNAFLFTFLKI